jgi:hypothetical protein
VQGKITFYLLLIGGFIATASGLHKGFGREPQWAQSGLPNAEKKVSAYQGSPSDVYTSPGPTYKVKEFHERVHMRDGVELAVKIIRPAAEGRFPAVMSYDAYRTLRRSREQWIYANEALGGAPTPAAGSDPREYYDYFAERGYAMVAFDARGTGDSGGYTTGMYSDAERQDGYDMVEWIAAQAWCNGSVGMWGISYGGVDTWQVAMIHPPHLKAIIVRSGTDDVYTDWAYPGGVPRGFWMYGAYLPAHLAQNFAPPDSEFTGEKWAEIWEEHLQHNSPTSLEYLNHQLDGPYWRARSLRPDYDRIKCAVFVIGGWSDWYGTAELRAFAQLKVPKRALIGPWAHFWPENALPGPRIDARGEYLKWFDQWLRQVNTGIMNEPPVTIFVTQYQPPAPLYIEAKGSWRYENEWPPTRTHYTPVYLQAEGKLSSKPDQGAIDQHDDYRYNPAVGVMNGIYAGGQAWPWAMPLDQRLDEAYSLTYTTPPLETDTEVTGQPVADIYVSSSAEVAYFAVKVCDVAPDGTSKKVTDGGLNATHRLSHAHPQLLKPGEVYELKIDLEYLAYVFPAGHRIRVDITSADFQNAWPVSKAALNSVHRNSKFPSRVILPIVPEQNPRLPSPCLTPSPNPLPTLEAVHKPNHRVSYDLINQRTTVSTGDGSTFTVSSNNPAEAVASATQEYDFNEHGQVIKVRVHEITTSDAETFHHLVEVDVTLDDKPYFHKSWTISPARSFN